MKPTTTLTNVEQVALTMFGHQTVGMNLTTKETKEIMQESFKLAYQFLDISKEFNRVYE